MFDIIIPFHNGLNNLRPCLESLGKTLPENSRLILVNDCSDDYVTNEIKNICEKFVFETVHIKNENNMGFLQSCNTGVSMGDNPYVVLVNSDTIMFDGTFQLLEETFESDPKIAVINPVSNWANWTRIPFPDGFNMYELNSFVSDFELFQPIRDIHNASGFFFAFKRELFTEYGLFDKIYGHGYYEEADFCMRIIGMGYRVVVHAGIYVFHQGWGSFGTDKRNILMERNRKIFMKRWGERYQFLEDNYRKKDPISDLKLALENPSKKSEDGEIKVVYILKDIGLYGGIISVLQVVNQLNLLGINANIACYGNLDEKFLSQFPMYFRPHVFKSESDMINNFPECDIGVATHWTTVYPLMEIIKRTNIYPVYFVQDFEPDFHEFQSESYYKAIETYNLIPTKIVKSEWLKNKMKHYDGDVHQIPLGLNTDVFYNNKKDTNVDVITHARPSSERRNFPMIKKVYQLLKKEDNSLELGVYGTKYSPKSFGVEVKDFGVLRDAKNVSEALNQSKILLDASTFQGFGRPGLEAMACGAATVLTRNGGITEYAKHNYNTLLVNPYNARDIADKIIMLLEDESLRNRLVQKGLETAEKYNLINEGTMTKNLFESKVS